MSASHLLALPLELQEQVIQKLGFPENVFLRLTCRHFYAIIQPLTHEQLLLAESMDFAEEEDIYACRDCLRLRPASRFADNMLKKKRARYGSEDYKRFCVECGLKTGPGNNRYTRGSRIMIQGVFHVVCIRCGEFGEGFPDDRKTGNDLPECLRCGERTRAFRRELRLREERFQRARLRAEQVARRERRRELYGSDRAEDMESDDLTPSPTWSEIHMDMIQAEADGYMNSPGPGSD